jgi:protein-disulfide isomerase
MKKEIYIIIGVVLVAVAVFFGASKFYKSSAVDNFAGVDKSADELLVKDWSPTIGPIMARVVVVEFLDPECESCRAMHPIVKRVLKQYEGRIRYVVRYMPYHQNSQLAASWLEAAGEQGKYWEALDALFEAQPAWAAHHAPRPELIPNILKGVGVNVEQAALAKNNPEIEKRIVQDKKDGTRAGVTGTPTFFINGKALMQLGESPLINAIEAELNAK